MTRIKNISEVTKPLKEEILKGDIHTIEEMKTICACGRKAMFNGRKINGKFIFDGEQVAIDGEDKITYESLCPYCYYDKLSKYRKLREQLRK